MFSVGRLLSISKKIYLKENLTSWTSQIFVKNCIYFEKACEGRFVRLVRIVISRANKKMLVQAVWTGWNRIARFVMTVIKQIGKRTQILWWHWWESENRNSAKITDIENGNKELYSHPWIHQHELSNCHEYTTAFWRGCSCIIPNVLAMKADMRTPTWQRPGAQSLTHSFHALLYPHSITSVLRACRQAK